MTESRSLVILTGPEFLARPAGSPWDFTDLARLHSAVDEKCRAQEALGPMACRKGCHHCCRRIPTVLPVEYAFIARNQEEPETVRPEALEGRTEPVDSVRTSRRLRLLSTSGVELRSLLHPGELLCGHLEGDGSCGIYGFRPLICRTHGFLHLSEEGLDHCPWNFQGLEEVDEDLPFRLESLSETLLRVNLSFLRKSYPRSWMELAQARIRFQ